MFSSVEQNLYDAGAFEWRIAQLKKRLVKAPKVYLRDSGILHYLLGIGTADQLLTSPERGNSFEGFMIQQIAAPA
jgi:predicted AAA+ superfamily ATPase